MLKARIPIYMSMLLVLIALFVVGCDGPNNDDTKGKVMSLTGVLKSDFSNVNEIDVQFSDGNKFSVTDSKTIQDIVSRIKSIEVRETDSKGVGYLYFFDLKDGNQTYRLDSNLTFGGKNYESTNDNSKKLNDFILKLGRDRIPGLLPGVQ
ncbi:MULTISPECIES: hypothetical protein [Paenibacillus]|uniref:Lipoprotein n=1 Tax=Paenibacillus residui TaxID=629724 RepID=A0ABW3D622_9BACL